MEKMHRDDNITGSSNENDLSIKRLIEALQGIDEVL